MSSPPDAGKTCSVTAIKAATPAAGEMTAPAPASIFKPETVDQNYPVDEGLRQYDQMMHAALARMTGGISPVSLARAYVDWSANLLLAPGKQLELASNASRQIMRLCLHTGRRLTGQADNDVIQPMPHDKRFQDEGWSELPFSLYKQSFLLTQQWWHNATTGVVGMSAHHEAMASFIARQMVDAWSPSNFISTNPELQRATTEEGGANLVRGWQNFVEDWSRRALSEQPQENENFRPGREVAVTPGQVVFRNHLIELIQYAPTTSQVHPEPLLIVPAWIMKYYILDLSPENSFIKYLVDQGHTVFVVSWRNPDASDRDLCMEDYRRKGVMAALDAVGAIVPGVGIHGIGYCLGGTLLAIAAAAMARDDDTRLASMTLLAAQTDFSEAGELGLFIDTSQVAFLTSLMRAQGYLDTSQMAGAFTMLRPNDLLWSRLRHEYLLGERGQNSDLMAWNSDATRMPYKMHAQYLQWLFLENRLARGKYEVEERPIALTDLEVPLFAVGTAKDHVAPWRSVYKIRLLTHAEVTFLLTSGGHNGGIVTPIGHPRRIYQVSQVADQDHYVDPDRWRTRTPVHQGSWWPALQDWLSRHSGHPVAPPRELGSRQAGYPVLGPAPGTYVHQH